MNERAQLVVDHTELSETGTSTFISLHKNEGWHQVFGGQLIIQALKAGSCTVPDDKKLISFHSIFVAPGDLSSRITYRVDVLRDGKSFSTREVVATQNDKIRFKATITFQVDEVGLDYQSDMPEIARPEDCADLEGIELVYREYYPEHLGEIDTSRKIPEQAIEIRFVDVEHFLKPTDKSSEQSVWIKFNGELGGGQEDHKHILAYASDQSISHVAVQPHGLGGFNPKLRFVSLDHAMWFHRPFRADDWLLLVRNCLSNHSGRVLVKGNIYTRSGALVASLAQEGLIRVVE